MVGVEDNLFTSPWEDRRDEEGGWVGERKIRDKENILCLGGDSQRV